MKTDKHTVVAGIGEILWDMLPAGKQLGGAPANFAYFARKIGARAHVASCVGSDKPGREILRRLAKIGVDRRYVSVDKSHVTGVVDVQLDKKGKPAYNIKRNVAWDFIRLSPALRGLAGRTKAVCFGTLAQRSSVSRKTIRKFIKLMPDSSLKIFDINLRQSFYNREIIQASLKLANILKINDEELPAVSRMFALRGRESDMAAQLIRKYKLQMVALTKGAKGAAIYLPERAYFVKGQNVKVIDTVGAGDSFAAGLAVGLLNGMSMRKILVSADRLAGYVCGKHGATPPLPDKMRRMFQGG